MESRYRSTRKQSRTRCLLIGACVVAVVSLILFFVGIVLIVEVRNKNDCKTDANPQTGKQGACSYSEEARRVGLDKIFQNAQDKYYELNPHKITSKPGVDTAEIKQKYKAYDPSPMRIKLITDEAQAIANKLANMAVDENKLTLKEKRAKSQLHHWAFHSFPFMLPFAYDYYVGDWMMGPDIFCWMPICFVLSGGALRHFKPYTVRDMEDLKDKFIELNQTFAQYVENLKQGVSAGMVRTLEECKAGLDGLKGKYRDVALKGPTGIYDDASLKPLLASDFTDGMSKDQKEQWSTKYGKSTSESMREFVLEFVGRPIDHMLRFIEHEHMQNCAPDSASTGLGSLPLTHIYVNGSRTNEVTTQKLPSGERLSGKKSYEKLLHHFTTTDQTPDEVYEIGNMKLKQLYNEVLDLAKKITGESDNATAKVEFIKKINSSDMFYSEVDIPANESDANAHKLCSSSNKAQLYCPKRWKAMQSWFDDTKQIILTLDYETTDLFYFTGPFQSTPNCPIKLVPDFNPSSPVPFYQPSDRACSKVATYNMPFFLARPGPKYESISLAAHEALPGHHTQVQGYTEHFTDTCDGPMGWIASSTLYLAFSEGWALYAENPLIPKYTSMYTANPISKYGMLKWQVWRALRLMMDTGLHYKGESRDWALKLFEDYAWDTSDVAFKEVTRYQSIPGQAVTYMLGQQIILGLKDEAMSTLQENFNIKDFHYQVLREGPSPLSHLQESTKQYISCVQDRDQKGCDEVMSPPSHKATALTEKDSVFSDAHISPWVL